jgi:pimeloyl-ACP methyl ester carboxylesterase
MRELWFENAGVRLFAVEDGEGPVIVMLHGGMASHVASLPLVAPLSSRYRIVTPDVRGNGKSWSGDAASVVATSRFIASGAQPFTSATDLRSLSMPTLLIRGDDPLHPAEVSDLYAEHIPNCSVLPASTADVAAEIGAFCDQLWTYTTVRE